MTLNLQLGESQKKVTLQFEVKQRKAALLPHVWHSCWKCLSAGAEKMRTQRFSLVFTFSQVHRKKLTGVLKCAKCVFYPSRVCREDTTGLSAAVAADAKLSLFE